MKLVSLLLDNDPAEKIFMTLLVDETVIATAVLWKMFL